MFRTDFAAQSGSGFAAPSLPSARPAAGHQAFAVEFNALRDEIRSTVRDGFGSSAGGSALQAQAAHLVARLQGAAGPAGGPVTAGTNATQAALRLTQNDSLETQRQTFIDDIMPWAARAGARLGTSPEVIAAHAALESGWGSRPMQTAQGGSAHNLFGIKATGGWRGAVAETQTTEYVNGSAVSVVDRFRAYPDYESAFSDYTRLIKENPRYAAALGSGNDARAFARALKQGGYATDPAYEDKLVSVARQLQAAR
ncbi:glucosaminidase domain-containing protein [Paraburkholderia bonniea]|uniref:glucosaminidase domain-containing protein n=1 Tax=Paraburkholderia bonniea TaxID=2152891 RepID=UPI002572E80B|nr:glucosaminidase domain-containing protein [Paraburkholderia bonniea]WJF90787.1 glucosaminidase domain-containing protein [Paraburkholderia bonniea]WJF94101.1 glucosaminidase domain-containing protein [Paraburkholderia bonniea]